MENATELGDVMREFPNHYTPRGYELLLYENSILREKLRELKQALIYTDNQRYDNAFRLRPCSGVILDLLMRRESVSGDAIAMAIWPNPDIRNERERQGIRVNVCYLRRALKSHGIEIETIPHGWRISPENKAKVRELLKT